jgi:ribosome-associated translation inhibitor RaiA
MQAIWPMPKLTASTPDQPDEAERGRADSHASAVTIRSRVELPPDVERAIRASLDHELGNAAALIERGTVQFEDIEGPEQRIETLCRIRFVLSGRPLVAAEEHAADPQAAFDLAIPKVARVLEEAREEDDVAARKRRRGRGSAKGKRATNPRGATHGRSAGATYQDPGDAAGSVIGRRVGHGAAALQHALARPEKQRRDAYLDTSVPGVAESERRAGGGSTARRNTKARPRKSKQVALLEDSRTKPSRKSTRRSATRTKQGTAKERTERGILYAPSSRTVVATARDGSPKRR